VPKLSEVMGAAPATTPAAKKLSDIAPQVPRAGLTPAQDAQAAAASPIRGQMTLADLVAGRKQAPDPYKPPSLVESYTEPGRRAAKNIAGDITRPVKPGIVPKVLRAGKTLADVGDYVLSPITGAVEATVGRPAQAVTGMPARQVAEGVMASVPVGYGATKSKTLKDGAKAVEKVLSPTTIAPEAGTTERTIRRATGQGSLEAEKSAHELIKHSPLVGNMPVPQQRALIDYIENRSKRGRLADPKLQAAADAISKVYDRYKARIQYILGQNGPSFVTDYYSHLWKEKPGQVQDALNAFYSKQGSGRSLKQRSIPTISDGIAAGLTPKQENPIEATMTYAQNMSRYLATHDIQEELKSKGLAKFYAPGQQPQGWVKVEGINTTRNPVIQGKGGQPQAHPMNLYAPEAAARVYNNFISKGMEQGDGRPFYQAARAASNGLTQLKLGLSAFHLSTMANEGIIGQVAKSFGQASRGQFGEAGKTLLKAPGAPVTIPMRGKRMGEELVGARVASAADQKINDLYVKSGGRLRIDPFYTTRGASGSFYNAMEKGTFARELGEATRKLYTGTLGEKAKAHVDMVGNAIQTVSAPLFEKYIPAMKRGAFASRMEDFLKQNPNATEEEMTKYAVKLNDSIDNRFGELVTDNLFWKKSMKQAAQIALTSFSWDLGTVREIAGGLADAVPSAKGVLEGKGITDRTAYVAALAATTALENGIATYLKTGTAPQSAQDLMAYRTGGTDATSGQPERAMTPGYQKDVYAFGYNFPHNILAEGANKLNPAVQTVSGLLSNKDYRGLPIVRPQGAAPVPGEPGYMDFILDTLMPISIGQFSKGEKIGSNISPVEQALSIRPAPSYITAPERTEALRKKYDTQDWRRRIRSDQRIKARQQP
jgi:hypothetical protein